MSYTTISDTTVQKNYTPIDCFIYKWKYQISSNYFLQYFSNLLKNYNITVQYNTKCFKYSNIQTCTWSVKKMYNIKLYFKCKQPTSSLKFFINHKLYSFSILFHQFHSCPYKKLSVNIARFFLNKNVFHHC